jgi:methylated-DNA-[protein]-cysteine S-methyltransferase
MHRPTLHRLVDSPVGPILLRADASGRLTGLRFGDDSAAVASRDPEVARHAASRVLDDAAAQLDAYFAGQLRCFEIPLAMKGSPFQRRVWAHLQLIPFGTTLSYGQLAMRLGRPGSARAVGHANARNPIAIIVPCHRVIGSSGRLTGYGGGLSTKRQLLDLEGGGASLLGAVLETPDR